MDLREFSLSSGVPHPWEIARERFFVETLVRHAPPGPSTRVLDVGSGDAALAASVQSRFGVAAVTCWDSNYGDTVGRALRDRHPALHLTPREPDGEFDLVMMMDVLEHVEEDEPFLRHLVRSRLRRGGRLLLSVPAQPLLWTSHDGFLHHYRRYRPEDARALIAHAGLRPIVCGGLFHSLLLPRALAALRERFGGDRPATKELSWSAPKLVTRVVGGALALDNQVSRQAAARGIDLPGLSWWALCERSDPLGNPSRVVALFA